MALAPYSGEVPRKGLLSGRRAWMMGGVITVGVVLVTLWAIGGQWIPLSLLPTATPTPTITPTPTVTPTNTPTPSPSPTPVLTPSCPIDPSKYSFESGDMEWVHQTFADSQGVLAVAQSEKNVSKFGCYSLKLTVDLAYGQTNKSKGEAYVDLHYYPPAGVVAPLNLEGVQISAWVYVPGTIGLPDKPHGVQLFVKDEEFRGEYGSWFNLTGAGWIKVTLTPGRTAPLGGGYMDSGFNPTRVVLVGIKVGAGDNSTPYLGPIYVDAVDW